MPKPIHECPGCGLITNRPESERPWCAGSRLAESVHPPAQMVPVLVFTEDEVRPLREWARGMIPFLGARLGSSKTMELRAALTAALEPLEEDETDA